MPSKPIPARPAALLNCAQAARLIGCDAETVRFLAKNGRFVNAHNAGARSREYWRIPRADVDAFLTARRATVSNPAQGVEA